MKPRLKTFLIVFGCLPLFSCASSQEPMSERSLNFIKIGSFSASYDASTGVVEHKVVADASAANTHSRSPYALDYEQTTGLSIGAIEDTSLPGNDPLHWMGLVNPESCTSEYNPTTKTLSFYSRIINKSNLPNSAPYVYHDLVNFPPNTTFYTPFHFVLTGLDWNTFTFEENPPLLISAINTNLGGALCGAVNGLTLSGCDVDLNNRFDSVYPDNPVNDYQGLPGFDFTPYITSGAMLPGDDSGCVLFMQFTLAQNESFKMYYDLLGVKDDGSLPPKPVVTSPATATTYVNTNSINVTINNCASGRTLYVEGGTATASSACTGASKTVAVTLNPNTVNNLAVYQIEDATSKQSPSANLEVTHDNVAPQVIASTPANGETNVNEYANCVVTFSEAIKSSTVTSGTNCTNGTFRICRGTTFVPGSISISTDATQIVYDPTAALNTNAAHTCAVTTGITDLAGNSVTPAFSAAFTTRNGAFGADVTPPFIRATYPGDNATIPRTASAYVYFSEPVQLSSLTATDCSSGNGTKVPNLAMWQTSTCSLTGYPTSRPYPVSGTVSLNADGDIATFTPDTTLNENDCLGLTVSSCVRDLSGNTLPQRESSGIAAYPGQTLLYHRLNLFFTEDSPDSAPPVLVHTGPMLDATSVHERVYPFYIFNEPIDVATMISEYFYLTLSGSTTKIAATLRGDPSLQMVTLKPNAALSLNGTHLMTATGAVTDVSGNQMTSPQTSQFTVRGTADTTAPTVVSVVPTNVTTGNNVSKCTMFDVNFSEAVDTYTLNGTNIQLEQVATGIAKPTTMIISDDGASVRLIPDSSLYTGNPSSNRTFRVIVSNVKDRAGNTISPYTGTTFTAVKETTRPTVTAFAPPTGSTVSKNSNFVVFFSEAMNKSTITNANFPFGGGACAFSPEVFSADDGDWVVVNCYNDLSVGNNRTLTPSRTNLRDRYNATDNASCEATGNGNRLNGTPSITFNVSNSDDTTPPTVSTVSPSDGSISVSTAIAPSITFDEEIDPRSVMPTTVFLMTKEGDLVPSRRDLSSDAKTITLTPTQALANPGIYYVVATTALRDLRGGNFYNGDGGELVSIPGVLRTCFSTSGASCP